MEIAAPPTAYPFSPAPSIYAPAYPTEEPPLDYVPMEQIPVETPVKQVTNAPSAPIKAREEKVQTAKPSEKKVEKETEKNEKTEPEGKKLKGYRKWQEVVRRLAPTEGLFMPFLQAAYAYEGTDGKFYIFFENKFGVTLLTDTRKQTLCAAVNTAGAARQYIPADIIGTVRDDVGGIREPIEDLLEMEEADVT